MQKTLVHPGSFIFAVAIIALGVQCLVSLQPPLGLEPLPSWLKPGWPVAVATATVFVGCGICLLLRWHTRPAAMILGSLMGFWFVFLHVPKLVSSPANGSAWTVAFETLSIGGAAWVLAGVAAYPPSGPTGGRTKGEVWTVRVGRYFYGGALPVFGMMHLVFWRYVSSVIPTWLPGPLVWTYFTAAAFFAAGAGIVFRVRAGLVATWTGVMFLLWVLLLHLPRVLANSDSRAEWTSLLVALAMGGGAWIIADLSQVEVPLQTTPDQR